jgi:DNA-binding MarR family transcriptional regulator
VSPTPDDDVDLLIDAWSDVLPGVDLRPLDVMSRLRRVARRLDDVRRRSFAAAELTIWEFDVLAALRRQGPAATLTPAELITLTKASSGTMTHRMDKLEDRGLIERRPHPADGRAVLVVLTEDGAQRVDRAMTELARREADMIRGIDPADTATVVRVLRMLASA